MNADAPFEDPAAVARYREGLVRTVPGLGLLHELVELLLGEAVPEAGRVLVVGAGGGTELEHLASRHRAWRFDGVDPSAEMLRLAASTTAPHADRIALHHGHVFEAPRGPFDAATCLLTLHFVEPEEQLRTLQEIRALLRPGSPLLAVHHSIPGGESRAAWLRRNAAFSIAAGAEPAQATANAVRMAERLPLLTPQEDEALMRDAGFVQIETFFAALTFRGWIARA